MTGRREETSFGNSTVSTYYGEMTDQLVKATGDLQMIHFGLWGPGVATDDESMIHSVHALVDGCDLGPGKRVLDAGCGLGGPAVLLAREYGVHVTGLTVCKPHIAAAEEFAARHGVGHLVDFVHGDFMDMPFDDASFDIVTNQESFCYAEEKLDYLRGAKRVLKPAGQLRILDGLLSGAPMTDAQHALHLNVQRACRMAPLVELRECLDLLGRAGFEDISERDLDEEGAPAVDSINKRWKLLVLLTPPPKQERLPFHELMQFTLGFGQGLREGVFTYRLVSGVKPA